MKKLTVLLALAICAPAVADEIEMIKDAQAKSDVRIFNISGEIEVEGWSRNQVEVTGDLGSDVKELIFEVDGDDVLIEVKVDKGHDHNTSSDLVIRVPEGSSVDVGTVSADITVMGVQGRQQLQSVSGDIESSVFAEEFRANSVSGDIVIQGDGKEMRTKVESVSGDLDMENLDGVLEANSVSGDVTVADSRFSEVNMQTVNGDLEYLAELYGDSRMHMETVNGEIDINFDGDVSARFDIETFNGDINNCFGPESQRTSKYAPGRELKFTEGGGKGRVVVRTLNGDLDLCK